MSQMSDGAPIIILAIKSCFTILTAFVHSDVNAHKNPIFVAYSGSRT